MSNRIKLNKGTSQKVKVATQKKETADDNSKKNSFLSAKKAKGSKPNNYIGKSSKVFF